MNIDLYVSDKSRITIDQWNAKLLDLKIYVKSMDQGEWCCVSGVVMPHETAKTLAIMLLNQSGNSAALAKKYRWDS